MEECPAGEVGRVARYPLGQGRRVDSGLSCDGYPKFGLLGTYVTIN